MDITRVFVGKNILYKVYCDHCEDFVLIGEKYPSCDCGKKFEIIKPKKDYYLINDLKRKNPSAYLQKAILQKQDQKCFYCKREFNSYIKKYGKPFKLKCVWDHYIPYSYLKSNPDDNWRVACNICNGYKSNLTFTDEIELFNYINRKWAKAMENGYLMP